MDSEDLEKLLESVFDVETEDIVLSDNSPLPCKLLWIVSDGSYVTKDQIIAILTPSTNSEVFQNAANVNQLDFNQLSDLQHFENIGDVAKNNLILKSKTNGKFIKLVENLTELNSTDAVLGRIEASFCNHEVVVHGLCANCSSHVESSYKRKLEELSIRTDHKMSPGFITNHSGFEIDADLAYDMECNEILRYLDDRKLCLVLDLDNTLLHATSQKAPIDIDIEMIEVSSEQCKKDLEYIHNSSEDDTESLKLQKKLESCILRTIVFNESETTCCHSYFKLRPGIFNFFRKVSKNYKLFLFTMGTRQHANSALQILDSKGHYFGNRVFCRNDSRSCMKSLDRIFPKHKNLVLVIDDSEYVWTNNLGLIKVHPYYFFPDLTYLNNFDLNNLTKSSAALQSICNYSNFIWSKLIHTSNHNTGSSNEEKEDNKYKNNENNNQKVDDDGFAVPNAIKKPQFRYNGYLICNGRPNDIYSTGGNINSNNDNKDSNDKNKNSINSIFKEKTDLFKKIRIKDNDRQLEKLIKLLDNIYIRFYDQYDMLMSRLSNHNLSTNINDISVNNNNHVNNTLPLTHINGITTNNSNENGNNYLHNQDNNNINNNSDINMNGINNKQNGDITITNSNSNDKDNNSNENGNNDKNNITNNTNNSSKPEKVANKIDIKYLMDNKFLPKACIILREIRENILRNFTLYSNTCEFINLSLRNRSGGEDPYNEDAGEINFLLCSDFGKWAIKFGASISNRIANITHVIVNNRNSMIIHDTTIKKVHIKWLEAVIYCFEHIDEEKFNPDNWKTPFRSFWDVLES